MKAYFKYLVLLFAASFIGFAFTSCSDDDEDIPQIQEQNRFFDELSYIQNSLVQLDENGNFKHRVYGVALDPSDTTVISVGVENFEEAKLVFARFFPDTTIISKDGTLATLTTYPGFAELQKVNSKEGLIAEAEFHIPGLKYVSRMNFILSNAWPNNDISDYKVGKWYNCGFTTCYNKRMSADFLCIRSAEAGKPALLIYPATESSEAPFCETSIKKQEPCVDNMPSYNKMQEIVSIIGGNHWKQFKEYANGNLMDGEYWTCEGRFVKTFYNTQATVTLPNGELNFYNAYVGHMAYLFYYVEYNK